jgi:hypothetical protein
MTYGYMTHSFLNSTEHRQTKKMRQEFTAQIEAGLIQSPFSANKPLDPLCYCRSFEHSHEIRAHKQLKSDYDWRLPSQRSNDQPEYWNERR